MADQARSLILITERDKMKPELRASIIDAFNQNHITHSFQGDPSDPLDGTRIDVGPFLAVQVYETRPEPIWRFEGQAAFIARAVREVLRGVDVDCGEMPDDQPNPAIEMVHVLIDHLCADRTYVDTRNVRRADGRPGVDLVIANLYKMKLEGASRSYPQQFRPVRWAMDLAIVDYTAKQHAAS